MNEQDIIDRIDNETKDMPVPESLSPENMEKMLLEASKQQDTGSSNITPHRRKNMGLAFAACFGVLIVGLGTYGIINNHKNSPSEYASEAVQSTYDESMDMAAADESVEDSAEDSVYTSNDYDEDGTSSADSSGSSDEDSTIEKDLALAGDLHQAESYDEYYDAIHYAYEDYYAKYATVTNDTVAKEKPADQTETIMEDAEQSYVEENAVNDFTSDTADTGRESSTYKGSSVDSTKSTNDTKDDYSSTNTQEKSVDEGDIVKTDGEYIYTAHNSNGFGSNITITKADNGNLKNVGTINLSDKTADSIISFYEFYIYNNYLIAMYSSEPLYYSNEEDYAYRPKSNIAIYDISNKSKPSLFKSFTQSGDYLSSRISDGYLYTVSCFDRQDYIFDDPSTGRKQYKDYIPYLNDDMIPYKNLYYSEHLEMMRTYVVTSLNLKKPNKFTDSKAVSSSYAELYVSDTSIYLYSTIYDNITKTELLKITYDKGILTVGNRAVIGGYLYGSFALSEYKGNLRIVSTIPANNFSMYDVDTFTRSGATTDILRLNKDINALYVLDRDMHLIGRITGLAPGEQIYSARFMGDVGYFVTYENTDPLFSVDLSDPENPQIIGKLKIPGFSTYLHFYGKDTLLGIGEEIDPDTQKFLGIKLSMFDISDPANVTESDKYIIPNSNYSYALYDYKTIMIDPDKNIFGFSYDASTYDASNLDYYDFKWIYATYTYDKKKGFVETASYVLDEDYVYDYNGARGIYIGDYFYLITSESITSYVLGSTDKISSVYFK